MNQHEEDRVDDDEREDERLHASHDRPLPQAAVPFRR